jgi:Annexin
MKKNTNITKSDFTTKEKVQYSLLGVLVLGGSFFVGRKLIRKAKSTTEEKRTYEEGSAATLAKQIKMAFDNDMWMGWGTDEEALRKAVRAIPSKEEFRKVMQAYQNLYNQSMMKDMQEELTSSEYNEVLAIIAGKPQRYVAGVKTTLPTTTQFMAWAKRLKAAFDIRYGPFPGTDEDAIKAVFMEIPTQAVFTQVGKVYQQTYNRNLIQDLRAELLSWELASMLQILQTKPKA